MEVKTATVQDRAYLDAALSVDAFHPTTKSDFFLPLLADGDLDARVTTNVYSDEKGPILFVRHAKALRIDMCFSDNNDHKRNAAAMKFGWGDLVQRAKESGFTEIICSTNSPMLKKFGEDVFGFKEVQVDGEVALRKEI